MALQFGAALRSAGYDVTVAVGPTEDESIVGDLRDAGLEVRCLDRLRRRPGPATARTLARLVREIDVVCVLAFLQRDRAPAAWAARRAGVRCIWSVQGRHRFYGPKPLKWLKRLLYRRSARHVDRFVCTSGVIEQEVRGFLRVGPDRTSVLPNCIDTEAVEPIEPQRRGQLRRELGVADDEILFVNVGRTTVEKAHDVLLEAFSLCGDGLTQRMRLVVVGGVLASSAGSRTTALQRRLQRFMHRSDLDGRVTFAGWRDDVPDFLASADAYVHASRSEGPALPLAVMEAMASGLPVIFTDCSGRPEGFVDGRDGFIVPADDAAALSRAMSRLAGMDGESRRRMGEAGRTYCRDNCDIRRIAPLFTQEVERVLDPQGVP